MRIIQINGRTNTDDIIDSIKCLGIYRRIVSFKFQSQTLKNVNSTRFECKTQTSKGAWGQFCVLKLCQQIRSHRWELEQVFF